MKKEIFEEESDEWGITPIVQELYAAMENNAVERRWKKLAIQRVLDLETLRLDLQNGEDVSEADIRKTVRQGEDLLNQLNRY